MWTCACAGEDGEAAEDGPLQVPAAVACAAPQIDGVLDDPCWEGATHITTFRRERVDAPPLEPTEAWICYDERAIYAAFRCDDSKPSEIRCAQKKRGGQLWHDDFVMLGLDVADDGTSFYQFRVNPVGTQTEDVPGGTSEKIEWKGDWVAAATMDEAGWSVEMEIPFSILRYPQGQSVFRCFMARQLARQEDWATWPPAFARVWDTENCARWTGVTTPPVPLRCAIMPYALSVASEDEDDRETLTVGLDAKTTFPNGVVGLFTYNPDFRNLEDVVETIDFTFVERYLPEYRPFFREGEWYMPSDAIFYSRRVEELDFGLKTFGTLGRHRFGALDAYNSGGENHLALNYEYLFGTRGGLRLSAVDRRFPGEPDNFASGTSAHWGQHFDGGNTNGGVSWYRSRTDGPGGDDATFDVNFGTWHLQGLGWRVGYGAVGSDFQADDGYVPETGVRSAFGSLSWQRRYDEGALQSRDWHVHASEGASNGGHRLDMGGHHDWDWRSGWAFGLGIYGGERDGLDVSTKAVGLRWNRNDMYRDGSAALEYGERLGDTYRYQSIRQGFHPTERWSGQVSFERVFAAEEYDDGNIMPPEWSEQLVLTNTYDISDERSMSARLVHANGDTNFYAAYRQRVRRGMDLLVVVGDPNAEEWVSRVAAKAIWCFD